MLLLLLLFFRGGAQLESRNKLFSMELRVAWGRVAGVLLPCIRIKFDVRMCKVLTVKRAWHAKRRDATLELPFFLLRPDSHLLRRPLSMVDSNWITSTPVLSLLGGGHAGGCRERPLNLDFGDLLRSNHISEFFMCLEPAPNWKEVKPKRLFCKVIHFIQKPLYSLQWTKF